MCADLPFRPHWGEKKKKNPCVSAVAVVTAITLNSALGRWSEGEEGSGGELWIKVKAV